MLRSKSDPINRTWKESTMPEPFLRVPFSLLAALVLLLLSAAYLSFAIPTISFVPLTLQDDANTSKGWVYVNITSDEPVNQSLLEWGNSSGFTNVTMINTTGSETNWYINMTDIADGTYNYTVWAQNLTGDWNMTPNMRINVDTVPPVIYIQSPQNTTYSKRIIDLNVSADEIAGVWQYSVNGTQNVTFSPNTTISVSGGANNITVYVNDSSGNLNSSTIYFTVNTTIEASLSEPSTSEPTTIVRNTTFLVNATVFCRQGNCGNVMGTVLYNETSAVPDTPVSTIAGAQPFYIQEESAQSTKSCILNPLSEGQFCNITWVLNATDATFSSWKIAVNFSSDTGWTPQNTTPQATVSIDTCFVDLSVTWTSVDFGTLSPSTYKYPALGNAEGLYNLTINGGSCSTDIYIKGTNIENSSLGYSFGVGNLTWSNESNSYSTSFNMSQSYAMLKSGASPVVNITTWYWINVPPVFAAAYNSTIYIKGVKSGSNPP